MKAVKVAQKKKEKEIQLSQRIMVNLSLIMFIF